MSEIVDILYRHDRFTLLLASKLMESLKGAKIAWTLGVSLASAANSGAARTPLEDAR